MKMEFNWSRSLIPFVQKLEHRGYVCDLMINSLLLINDESLERRITRIVFDITASDDLVWRWEMPLSVIDAHIQIEFEVMRMSHQQRSYLMGDWLADRIGNLSASSTLPPLGQALIRRFPVRFLSVALPDHLIARCYSGMHLLGRQDISLDCPQPENSFLFPLDGCWQVTGNFDNTLAHRHTASREYGMDFLKLGLDGKCRSFKSESLEDYHGFGAMVRSAADGRVVSIRSDAPDTVKERLSWISASGDDIRSMSEYSESRFGNHVLIDHENGFWSYYCHLKQGSVQVKEGDRIQTGDSIAELGNSGDSRIPHLHFQINDGPNPHGSRSIPIYFSNLLDMEDRHVPVVTRNNSVIHTG